MKMKDRIYKWEENGLITKDQADLLWQSFNEEKQDDKSSILVSIISVVGSILLTVGIIFFLEESGVLISSLFKSIIMVILTGLILGVGYRFNFGPKKLPKVGHALVFLGSLLTGVTVFYIAHFYKVNLEANSHWLLFVSILFIIPHLYIMKSKLVAVVLSVLIPAFLWFFTNFSLHSKFDMETILGCLILVLSGCFVYCIGQYHCFSSKWEGIGNTFKLISIQVFLLGLFILCFPGNLETEFTTLASYLQPLTWVIFLFVLVFCLISLIWFLAKQKLFGTTYLFVHIGWLFSIVCITIFTYFLLPIGVASTFYNLLFIAVSLVLLFSLGNKLASILVANTGILWIVIFLIARSADIFGDKVPSYVVILFSGVVLVLGGVLMEIQRKRIQKNITKK